MAAVEVAEFPLAERLFEVALLIDVPDMFFVLHKATRGADAVQALEAIVQGPVVGRAWAQFYA